jgi:hypothetical protein
VASWQNQTAASVVAFKANISNTNQIYADNTGGYVMYPVIDFNDGGGYDSSTGIFTAPSSGIYHFDANLMTSGGQYCYFYLEVGGVDKGVMLGFLNQITALNLTLSVTVKCNAGDTVRVRRYNVGEVTSFVTGGGNAGFSGHKVN